MDEKLNYNTSNEKGIREQITSKSNNIKAALKSKYLIYKLQREFFRKKFN